MYKALSQALTGKASDSGACAHYAKLVESRVPAINVVFPWTDHMCDLLSPQISPPFQPALYDVNRILVLLLNRN